MRCRLGKLYCYCQTDTKSTRFAWDAASLRRRQRRGHQRRAVTPVTCALLPAHRGFPPQPAAAASDPTSLARCGAPETAAGEEVLQRIGTTYKQDKPQAHQGIQGDHHARWAVTLLVTSLCILTWKLVVLPGKAGDRLQFQRIPISCQDANTMAPFVVPADSLSRRYSQAYRRVTWKKVRTARGVKVLPPVPSQIGPTCIYVALMAWLESHLRLRGIIIRLSPRDLEDKEQALMTEEDDRTARCFEVLANMGVCSEYDYENKILDGTRYRVVAVERFFSLNKEAIEGAIQSMEKGPLLLVFNCDKTYQQYVWKYHSRPILSYEKYKHEEIDSHAANAVGYCIENIVPGWEFMNSYGKSGPKKGFGRVLAQNAVRLIGMKRIEFVHPRGDINVKRKREFRDDEEESRRRSKKLKLQDRVELAGEDLEEWNMEFRAEEEERLMLEFFNGAFN